jgi:hypothetical protein
VRPPPIHLPGGACGLRQYTYRVERAASANTLTRWSVRPAQMAVVDAAALRKRCDFGRLSKLSAAPGVGFEKRAHERGVVVARTNSSSAATPPTSATGLSSAASLASVQERSISTVSLSLPFVLQSGNRGIAHKNTSCILSGAWPREFELADESDGHVCCRAPGGAGTAPTHVDSGAVFRAPQRLARGGCRALQARRRVPRTDLVGLS